MTIHRSYLQEYHLLQSGLEGAEITFIISFMKAENFDAWHKNTFPEVAKDGE
jgi:hypothetical protein